MPPPRAVARGVLARFFWGLSLLALAALATGEIKPRTVPAIHDETYQQLVAAEQAQAANDFDQAIDILRQLDLRTQLNSYERATLYHMLGYLHYLRHDLKQSISAYEQALAQADIPLALELEVLYTLSKMNLLQENYPTAIGLLNRWFSLTSQPSEEAYVLRAQAYFQTSNYQLVVDNLLHAIDLIEQKNQPPDEQWLLLLQQSYLELGLAERQVKMLKWLIRLQPRRDYLLALSSTYGMLEQTDQQLAVLEVAYLRNHLTQASQLLTLASLQFSQGAPYKAAQVLQRGIDQGIIAPSENYLRFLAGAWIAAQEHQRAIPVLHQAARLSTSGELIRLAGNAWFQLDQWEQATQAYRDALAKGQLQDPGQVWLIMGQAYVNARQYDDAAAAFTEATQYDATRHQAHRWLTHNQNLQQRYQLYLSFQKTSSE